MTNMQKMRLRAKKRDSLVFPEMDEVGKLREKQCSDALEALRESGFITGWLHADKYDDYVLDIDFYAVKNNKFIPISVCHPKYRYDRDGYVSIGWYINLSIDRIIDVIKLGIMEVL